MSEDEGLVDDVKRLRLTLERSEGGGDILRFPNFECDNLKADLAGRRLNLAQLQHANRSVGIDQGRQPLKTRDGVAQ